jgi:hypothetical protein
MFLRMKAFVDCFMKTRIIIIFTDNQLCNQSILVSIPNSLLIQNLRGFIVLLSRKEDIGQFGITNKTLRLIA